MAASDTIYLSPSWTEDFKNFMTAQDIFNLPLTGPYLSPSGSDFIAEQPIVNALMQPNMGTTTRGLSTGTWIAIGFAGLVAIMIFGKR